MKNEDNKVKSIIVNHNNISNVKLNNYKDLKCEYKISRNIRVWFQLVG